jgi:hypothetical protein
MDFDRLYIQDLLDTVTLDDLAAQPVTTPADGAEPEEGTVTTQSLGEEGDDPENPTVTTQSLGEEGDDPESDIPFDELPFTSGPAETDGPQNPTIINDGPQNPTIINDDPQNPTVTTQSLGEEGDDPEADPEYDPPFSVESDDDSDDHDSDEHEYENVEFGDDDLNDDDAFDVG